MRILYVVHSIPPVEFSGTPLIAWQYAQQAAAIGATVAIAFARPAAGPPLAESTGITLIPLAPAPEKPWTLAAFAAPPRRDEAVAGALRKFRPDIVHIIDWVNLPSSVLAAIAALKVPVLRHVWNLEDVCAFIEPIRFHPNNRLCHAPLTADQCGECLVRRLGIVRANLDAPIDEAIAKLVETRAAMKEDFSRKVTAKWRVLGDHLRNFYDTLIFPCDSVARYFAAVADLSAIGHRVIEHGIIEPGRRKAAVPRRPGAPLTCVFMGPCTGRKGWDVVEQSFAQLLPKAGGKLKLKVYGGRAVAARTPLARLPGVDLLDTFPISQLEAVLAGCDLGLVPSPFETFSRVCREMLAHGIPVIGSNAFGIPDAITHGLNGLLLGDPSVDGLVTALRRVLDEDGLLDTLAAGAQATPLRSPQEEFAELADLYRAHLDSRAKR